MNKKQQLNLKNNNAGFTLVELLAVVVISGILVAVSVNNLTGFINKQRVDDAGKDIYHALRTAQNNARAQKEVRQLTLRQEGDIVYWAVGLPDTPLGDLEWNNSEQGVELEYSYHPNDLVSNYDLTYGFYYYFIFDYKGNPEEIAPFGDPIPKIITLKSPVSASAGKRCIVIHTLLGNMGMRLDDDCDPSLL